MARQRIAGRRQSESAPVTKRGVGAAGVGYQRATGNVSRVSASCTAIVRYPTFHGGGAPVAVGALESRSTRGRRRRERVKTADELIPEAMAVLQACRWLGS